MRGSFDEVNFCEEERCLPGPDRELTSSIDPRITNMRLEASYLSMVIKISLIGSRLRENGVISYRPRDPPLRPKKKIQYISIRF